MTASAYSFDALPIGTRVKLTRNGESQLKFNRNFTCITGGGLAGLFALPLLAGGGGVGVVGGFGATGVTAAEVGAIGAAGGGLLGNVARNFWNVPKAGTPGTIVRIRHWQNCERVSYFVRWDETPHCKSVLCTFSDTELGHTMTV